MTTALIVIKCDLEKLQNDFLSPATAEFVFCVGSYEFSEIELSVLRDADLIYVVVSETSLCSTAYQALLIATFSVIELEKCRLLRLDNTPIPAGFAMLQNLVK